MTTGVYKLTFPSGKIYIGKSIDIENRWKQHWDKFSKGKHTKNMQQEFDLYRFYTREVIIECHRDHLDIFEETCIARQQPELNGTKGEDRLNIAKEHLPLLLPYFEKSTVEHVAEIHNTKVLLEQANDTIDELKEDLILLSHKRSHEELQADIEKRIEQTKAQCATQVHEIQEAFDNYRNLPWYRKIFT